MADPKPSTAGQRTAIAAGLAAAIAIPSEGVKLTPYWDPPGILTVCRGHTGADIVKGRQYSLAECDRLFTDDMRAKIVAVERCQPGLPIEVLAAFSDAAFNLGPAIACDPRKSTAARLLNAKLYEAACRQLPRWDKASVAGVMVSLPGLTKRRALEMDLCLQGARAAASQGAAP